MARPKNQQPVPEEVIAIAIRSVQFGSRHLERHHGISRSVAVRAIREARARLAIKSPTERSKEFRDILDKYAETVDVSKKTISEISRETGVNFRSVQRWRGMSGLSTKRVTKVLVAERFEPTKGRAIGDFVVINGGRLYSRNRPEDADFFGSSGAVMLPPVSTKQRRGARV